MKSIEEIVDSAFYDYTLLGRKYGYWGCHIQIYKRSVHGWHKLLYHPTTAININYFKGIFVDQIKAGDLIAIRVCSPKGSDIKWYSEADDQFFIEEVL